MTNNKVEVLKEITGKGLEYWQEFYVDEFYNSYKFISKIKEKFGTEAIFRLYDLVNSETWELLKILEHLMEVK